MNIANDKKDKKLETKVEKKPPANLEALPEGAIVIDSTRCKYIVDAFDETSKGLPAEYQPVSSFKKILQTYSGFTNKWQGLTGSDHISSTGERERMLTEANCFVFHGTERFLSYFNSSKINALNLNECRLLIINDLANTSESYSRIGKLDVHRNPIELECENSLETNILLTLAGVKSIMSNQWNSTLAENSEKLHIIFKEFFEHRQSCGEVIRFRMSPHIKKVISDAVKKEEEQKNATVDTKGKGDKKKDSETAVAKDPKTPKHTAKPGDSVDFAEQAKEDARKAEEEIKKAQFLKSLERLRKENFNMVLYGIPDIYMSN